MNINGMKELVVNMNNEDLQLMKELCLEEEKFRTKKEKIDLLENIKYVIKKAQRKQYLVVFKNN